MQWPATDVDELKIGRFGTASTFCNGQLLVATIAAVMQAFE
ncbi:hypothetical protein imdm_1365 [gamma proteobacterium IMCC2047]|nr:hypothetical protein imdm_1365 [gamma proteobacterium IMCC2047]